jgi:hypothetical protein
MKKIIIIAVIGLAALLAGVTAQAQTSTNTPSVSTFFTSAEDYLTSFNTNYTFSGVKIDFETGFKQVNGQPAASYASGNYYITANLEAGANITYFGAGSAINGGQASIGYALINHYDTRLTIDLGLGYDGISKTAVIEPRVEIKKKLSANYYASMGISLPIEFKQKFNSVPTFYTGVGFTY